MQRHILLTSALFFAALSIASLACSLASSLPSIPGISTDSPAADTPIEEAPLLEDDFSDSESGWGTGTDSDSAIEYENGVLRMTAFREYYFTWSTPDDEDYEDVHVDVTVNNDSGDTRLGFGGICNQQVVDSSFHYLAVMTDGEYAIARAEVGKEDLFLTNEDDWGTSEAIASGATTYRVGADCGQGRLTLYVDGKEIDSVEDSTFTSGGVGLFLWSAMEPSGSIALR